MPAHWVVLWKKEQNAVTGVRSAQHLCDRNTALTLYRPRSLGNVLGTTFALCYEGFLITMSGTVMSRSTQVLEVLNSHGATEFKFQTCVSRFPIQSQF